MSEPMAGREPFIYINGSFLPKTQAKISVYDHGFLYGDGVFEGIRAYNGIVFKLQEHMDRLCESAKYIKLTIPLTREQMVAAVLETLRKNRLHDAYIRVIVSRGVGDLGVDPTLCAKPSVVIIAEPVDLRYGAERRETGIAVNISSIRRDATDATTHEVKSLNYLNSVLAKIEANEAGVGDAVLLDHRGFVSEACVANLFLVKEGQIITPSAAAGILRGITRRRIIQLCRDLGFAIHERDITPFELVNADEVFLTGTKSELTPVVSINGRTIGTGQVGPTTKSLIRGFERIRILPDEGTPIYEPEILEH